MIITTAGELSLDMINFSPLFKDTDDFKMIIL